MTVSDAHRRALVLGGGGIVGIAWETGLLVGLHELGTELGSADVVVGTSAGSVVGAVFRGNALAVAHEWQLDPDALTRRAPTAAAAPDATFAAASAAASPSVAEPASGARMQQLVDAMAEATRGGHGELQSRAAIGEISRSAMYSESEEDSIERIRGILPSGEWPETDFRVTAVDAVTGTFRVFDSSSGVDLARAIAASCAVPGVYRPITIDGRAYMDGGMRSPTNADLAADCDRIVVVACMPEQLSSETGPTLHEAVATLRESADVLVVQADADSLRAFGTNPLLLSTREASAEAGRRQAVTVADEVRQFWG